MKSRSVHAVVLLVLLAACGSEPEWPYPTPLLDLPESFDPAPRARLEGRPTFPDRPPEQAMVWELRRGGDVSQIVLSRHGGSTRPEDLWAAVNRVRTNNQSWTVDGPTPRSIEGRPAWEWSASVPSVEGGRWASQRTLVVAYPDSTWVASFWGQHREWHDQADLDAVLSSFRVVVPSQPLPKLPLILVGALVLAGVVVRIRTRPKREPARPMPSGEPVHSPRANLLQQPGTQRDPAVMAGSGAGSGDRA